MEFTSIQELDKLINFSRSDRRDLLEDLDFKDQKYLSVATNYVTIQQSNPGEVEELLKQIDLYAMSMLQLPPDPQVDYGEEFGLRLKAQTEFIQSMVPVDEQQDSLFVRAKQRIDFMRHNSVRSSNMFRTSTSKNPYLKKENKVKIFYFGKPICKVLTYTNQTTISDLIQKSIFAYLQDPALCKSRIRTTQKSAYEMRMVDDDAGFKPDLELEPLDENRKAIDTMFESMVLMENNTVQVRFDEEDQKLIRHSPTVSGENLLRVFDQNGQNLIKKYVPQGDTLEIIFGEIRAMGRYQIGRFYLTETMDEELEVLEETRVSELETKKLYIKRRVFADDPDIIKQNPIEFDEPSEPNKPLQPESPKKTKSNSIEKISPTPNPPTPSPKRQTKQLDEQFNVMTLTSASNYEVFEVVKVNTWGIRQSRVLGIDQTKIYNYDKETHKDGEISLFSKIMGKSGYGTKRPERFIKDVVSIREVPEKNMLIIECKEGKQTKSLEFEANHSIRYRIVQKLTFLMNYLNKNNT